MRHFSDHDMEEGVDLLFVFPGSVPGCTGRNFRKHISVQHNNSKNLYSA